MNLDLDLSVLGRFFNGLATELRKNRPLAIVAGVLLLAVIAIPILLSKSSSPTTAPRAQLPATPAGGASIPALNVQTTPSNSRLTGPAHNPFGSHSSTGAGSTAGTTTTSTATALATATSGTASTSTGSSPISGGASTLPTVGSNSTSSGSSAGSSSSSTPPSSSPPSITGAATPKTVPTGLKSNQSYGVSLAMTNASGGLNTVGYLTRLTALPSNKQPLLVELGVLKGGHRVLFAVGRDAVVSGGGTCTPGPIDCEILSLAPNQTESVATGTGSASPAVVALFEVTGISKRTYDSRTAAHAARQGYSARGQAVLAKFNLTALSLFRYESGLGAVVDLRNLSVGR